MTGDPIAGNLSASLRIAQHYGELLAGFRRTQVDIAAEQDAKLAAWRPADAPGGEPTPPAAVDPAAVEPAAFDEDDFSNNTWLR